MRLNPNIQIQNPKHIPMTKYPNQKTPFTLFLSPEGEREGEGIKISLIGILVII
jgi:hypothetical protein